MKKLIFVMLLLVLSIAPCRAGQSRSAPDNGISFHKIANVKGQTQANDGAPPFIDPDNSMLKLGRQVSFQFLPADFIPEVETETDPAKLKNLRYAIAFYRDCATDSFQGLIDVLIGLRIDTNDGAMKVEYFNTFTIFNPAKVQYQEVDLALAALAVDQGSALVYVQQNGTNELASFSGLFSDPHNVNILNINDFDGVKADDGQQKFAVFLRGGDKRASLFVLNTDTAFKDVNTYEVFHNLPNTDRAYIFEILPPQNPSQSPYQVAPLKK
jgi:hypothetical protein